MSFGISPSDILKLLEISTKVYIAFKNANENSEAQVEGLVRELETFNRSLNDLRELMIEYGRPLPLPYQEFRETVQKCDTCIQSFVDKLIDKKMGFTKVMYTFKYMGKEKEIDGLRKQISLHCQSLQLCISSLQLRLQLEAMKQTQRLHIPTQRLSMRSRSLADSRFVTGSDASTSRTARLALPAPDEADELFKDWQLFSRHCRIEEDRIAREAGLSLGVPVSGVYAATSSRDPQTAAFLQHLHREIEDAVTVEENRAKRTAAGGRTHLGPSDAVRQELQHIPTVPLRTFTLESDFSEDFWQFDAHQSMSDSGRHDSIPSPLASPTQPAYLDRRQTSGTSTSVDVGHQFSASPQHSSLGTSPDIRLTLSPDLATSETTPELTPPQNVRTSSSASSLVTIDLGAGALDWKRLCDKVRVERTISPAPAQLQECNIYWRRSEDSGLVIRSVYGSGSDTKIWTTQDFPATDRCIPLTTCYREGDSDVSIDFPRPPSSRRDRLYIGINYTFTSTQRPSANRMQTLLYTNGGKDPAELLYDRCVSTVSSNLNQTECRSKNVRLWNKSETYGGEMVDVIVLLFYTSALSEDQAHWVEEPHYAFQWLTKDVCKKKSNKLKLIFSKEPGKWSKDKLLQRRKSSSTWTAAAAITATTPRRDSGPSLQNSPPSPVLPGLLRIGTRSSVATAISIDSSRSLTTDKDRLGNLNVNKYGYGELEITFSTKSDRNDFVEIWQQHVRQFGSSSSSKT